MGGGGGGAVTTSFFPPFTFAAGGDASGVIDLLTVGVGCGGGAAGVTVFAAIGGGELFFSVPGRTSDLPPPPPTPRAFLPMPLIMTPSVES
jgi:hypothetical protein